MGGLLASVATLWAHSSASAPTAPPPPKTNAPASSCSKRVNEARQHAEAGRLRRAREAYAECAKASCGGLVSQQCRSKLQQLDADIPSVIPIASDASGANRVDVRVSMDGELLASQIDGRSLEVDPGLHEFSFGTEQGDVHSEKVLILQGQRNRVLSVALKHPGAAQSAAVAAPEPTRETAEPPPPAAAAAAQPSEVEAARSTPPAAADSAGSAPVLAYVVGGVGIAAVGSAFLLAHWGREDNIRLDRCAPNCSSDSVDHVSNMYLAADITLGAGVVALGAATWLFLSRPSAEDPKSARGYHIDVRPTASGAFATVGSSF